jgi:multiple sugar transport system substrate-binding protein
MIFNCNATLRRKFIMTKLKRILAGSLALCMAGSMLTACGGDDSSKSDSKAADNASKAGGNTATPVDDADIPAADSLVNTGKKYNIYVWNTEFKERFETYYWPNRDEALWDGVEVNWVTNSNEGNVYQTKLDEAISGQNDAKDDDKIDMFLVEADYALKYVDSDICLDVRKEVGISESDTANQYKYTQDVMTDSNGILKGLSWQATPGLFLYNADYAKDVLGTDDPEEVQAMLSDWDKFNDVAAKMQEKGIAMVSGFDDTYRCFSNTVSSPWVTDGKITIDPQISAWVDQTKDYTDKGYNNKTSLWDDAWKAGQKIDGKTFGYFFSTWGIPFTLLPNTLDKSVDDGGKEEEGNGGYGNFVVIDHGNGFLTLYGHLTQATVEVGDKVKQGDQIGLMGSTGYSTGTHLHFELRYEGYVTNPASFVSY